MAKTDHDAIKQKRADAVERRRSIRDQKIAARDEKIAEHREKVGLRQQKKLETRQQISDIATSMFIDKGFDTVRVSDVAKAAGVSEKTVFNYFPTKESLVLDQVDPMIDLLRQRIGPGATDGPADAMADLVTDSVDRVIANGLGDPDMEPLIEGFMAMFEATPSLRAERDRASRRLVDTAAESLAERFGRDPDDAEIRVTAIALVGFWETGRNRAVLHARAGKSAAEIRRLTRKEMEKAAQLIHHGFDGALMDNKIGGPKKRKASPRK